MPNYEYRIIDLPGGETVAELDLYGTYCSRNINSDGQFQGNFKLQADKPLVNAANLAATAPGRYGLEFDRNGDTIWGGIIWSRSYASQGNVMQIFASTWESYFDHMVFWKQHFIQQGVAQEDIFEAIITQLQGQSAACNIGLTIPDLPVTNVKRTVLIPNYEYHFGSEAVGELVNTNLGLEYTIAPDRQVLIAAEGELGKDAATSPLMFDFPGQIDNYWMPESGASGAVKLATLGAGAGNKILRATVTDTDKIAAGYREWWKVTQYSDIGDLATIQNKNVQDFKKFRIPYLTPTFDFKPDDSFTHFNEIGSYFEATIQDIRYPSGKTFDSRMLGWDFTPAGSDNDELFKVQADGSKVVA